MCTYVVPCVSSVKDFFCGLLILLALVRRKPILIYEDDPGDNSKAWVSRGHGLTQPRPATLRPADNYPFLPVEKSRGLLASESAMCDYLLLKWYCEECGAWYTSDEVKVKDCDTFETTGDCDQKDIVSEGESDAGGLCDDCTKEHDD
ncbi:hypothetical protein F4809DRAFT_92810 [Biscogniauxia mediterranea]|nr:hypothetical protein F4809DRAFT_92810 [Biscogniauxia mediterranea]